MIVKQQLQEGVNVASLRLKFLRHRNANDASAVDVGELKGALWRAEHLGYLLCREMLEVVADRFPDPAELFFGLVNKPVGEVLYQPSAGRCKEQLTQVVQSALKLLGVGEKSKSAGQGDRPTQFKKQFEGVGNVGLRLALEESLVAATDVVRRKR